MDLKALLTMLILVNAKKIVNFKFDEPVDPYEESKYLINTPGCEIPWFKSDHIDKFIYDTCGMRQVLVRKVTDDKVNFMMLKRFDECCYKYYYRVLKSEFFDGSITCMPFKNDTTIIFLHEFISVHCKKQNETYEDYYAFVKKVENVQIRTDKSWNVIILGLDSMSRSRAFTSLKNTVAYLQRNQWLDYGGFNKVGKNTAPNLIPLLTGKSFDNSSSILSSKHPWLSLDCKSDTYKCNSHIIWHKYQKRGFVTAFGEESIYMSSIFQSHGWHGFRSSPTHHYLRPFFTFGEKKRGTLCCTGEISSAAQILGYAEDFVNTYKQKKFFGFFWITSHSHDDGQSPKHLDTKVVDFFKKLDIGILKNTFVFFMGDHGTQKGPARYGIQGFYDTKLPMFFMFVPLNFRVFYPAQYSNLLLNQKRLMSSYDLHMTLQDILDLQMKEFPKDFQRKSPDGCPMCMSLFQEIPDDRSCSDAAIIELFCSCREMIKTSVKEYGAMYSILKAYEYIRPSESINPLDEELVRTGNLPWCVEVFRIHKYRKGFDIYYIVGLRETLNESVHEVIVQKKVVDKTYVYKVYSHENIWVPHVRWLSSGNEHAFRVCEKQ